MIFKTKDGRTVMFQYEPTTVISYKTDKILEIHQYNSRIAWWEIDGDVECLPS